MERIFASRSAESPSRAARKGAAEESRHETRAPRSNATGLPEGLKAGLEALSGHSFDGVQVHYNSARPAELDAHAFARGRDIHLAPGHDRHLPHEAWHLVQQAQGRVRPGPQRIRGMALNEDPGLEREADAMGEKAARHGASPGHRAAARPLSPPAETAQLRSLSSPLSRNALRALISCAVPVVQRVKVDIGGGAKEVSELTEKEMETLMNLQPMLTEALEQDIVAWIERKRFSFVRNAYFTGRLARWKHPPQNSAPKKEKKKRDRKGEKIVLSDMYSDEESELSEAETDPDKWRERKPFGTTPVLNRSHVPTAEDKLGKDVPVTGMHHADTFLLIKQGGQFVPRTINARPNVEAHRKPLPEDQLLELAKLRDDQSASKEDRELAARKLVAAQRQLLFGSAIDWEEGEKDEELVAAQERHRRELLSEEGALGDLMRRHAHGGVRSGTKDVTHTDAEQKLLSSRLWKSMLMKLMESIDEVDKDPFYKALLAGNGIQLMLNRSSCLGCGKALALALVDFWKAVAAIVRFKTWREARDHYAALKLFRIAFPVIYQYDLEKSSDFTNFKAIMLGLQEAGWTVEAPTGIKSNAHAEENHQKLNELLKGSEGARKKVPPQKVEGGEDPVAQVRDRFRLGKASGEGNNCLLSTLYQLTHNTESEDRDGIETMRETLETVGLAEDEDMIDLYGGAGMQLANDLEIQIQVIQIVGGEIIIHPVLGQSGPLHYILHQGAHFTPLWLR